MLQERKIKVNEKEFGLLISKHITNINDIELLILKGHLLVEYILNKYIDSFSDHGKRMEESKFTFSQKIHVCKILGLFSADGDTLEEQILILNKIRNQIAHSLSFKRSLLNQLYKFHPKFKDRFKNEIGKRKDILLLTTIIPYVCGNIYGILETKFIFEEIVKEVGIKALKGKS